MADAGDVQRMERILARVRAYGVTVREVPGWQERGRTFEHVPCGIVDHHDASTRKAGEWGALGVITTGYGTLPGPLSQFQVARCLDGEPKVAVVAAGRANHAGRGGPREVGGYTVAENAANSRLYGAEKANDGLGEPYAPAAHYASDALFAAVLAEVRGEGVSRVIGHKEWANEGRKSDPEYLMDWRRERVGTFRVPEDSPPPPPAPEPTTPTSQESDMRPLLVKDPDSSAQYLIVPGVSRKHVQSPADVRTYEAQGAVRVALTRAELLSYPDVTAPPRQD